MDPVEEECQARRAEERVLSQMVTYLFVIGALES